MAIVVNLDMMLVKRKMKLTELSERIGISVTNLSLLKTGRVKGMRFSTLEAICRELDCQPGDILVAPGTSAQWTPAFEIITGIITDGGGALSHAVIVAREYGIPAVVGCLEATQKIKTGDKVKVDGDLGLVYILQQV